MTFTQSVSHVFSNYVGFSGRASRSEYWWFALFQFIIYCLFYVVYGFWKDDWNLWQGMGNLMWSLYCLVTFLPSFALSWRRMHDIGKGGGWIFINLVPFIGTIWYFILTLLPSQPGPNRFGETAR